MPISKAALPQRDSLGVGKTTTYTIRYHKNIVCDACLKHIMDILVT